MVTIREIARQIGVSRTTVSQALRGRPRVAPATQKRVQQIAQALGYRPNPIVSEVMTRLRLGRTQAFRGKLALVNANLDPRAFTHHPTIPAYLMGAERRAAQLGYGFDRFWLHDPAWSADRWKRVLDARGIKGLLLVGLMDRATLPPALESLWQTYACVVTGVRTQSPALSFSAVDHYHLAAAAFEKALQRGYQKPALVLDEIIDRLVDRRFSAGILRGQQQLPRNRRVPAFTKAGGGQQAPASFKRWLGVHQPDVLFILYNEVLDWLAETGHPAPRELGVIQLEWRAAHPEIAGMDQHNDIVGEAAVEMLISQINHQEAGLGLFPRATLIGATWVDGQSVQNGTVNGARRPKVHHAA